MITAMRFPTMNRLHDGIANKLLFGARDDLDLVTSVDVQLHNCLLHATSMEWEYNFKDLWIGRTRWAALTNQYVDRDSLDKFVEACGEKLTRRKRGVALMRMRTVTGGHVSGGKTWRRWGGCMLAVGFRSMPWPQITLHSRTSYLGYIGALDLTVAHCIAREVSEATAIPVEEMSFTWHLEAAQYHSFKSLAYVRNDPERWAKYLKLTNSEDYSDAFLRENHPAVLMHKKWFANFAKEDDAANDFADPLLYGDMKFGQTRRIRKRLHTETVGYEHALQFAGGDHSVKSQRNAFRPLPDLFASELTLDRIRHNRDEAGAEVDIDDTDVNDGP